MKARLFAWGVHLFTALGLIAAAFIAVLIVRGGREDFRAAFMLMFAATLIDAVDGWFARKARVKEVLPGFDGRRLDDLIDFLTYTCLPLLLIWRARILPDGLEGLLLLPLLASAYGFSQVDAKTADGYFLGFPSYWNIMAFYLFYLGAPAWFTVAAVVFFALMTFVPWCYLYSTQPGKLNRVSNLLAVVWVVLLVWILALPMERARPVAIASVFFPVFYLGASWWVTWKRKKRKQPRAALASET